MDAYMDEEYMKDVGLVDERERHWRMGFEEKYRGVDDQKATKHAKKRDSYMNQKLSLIKGEYYAEVIGYDGKRVLWEVVDHHIIEDPKEKDDIGLWGLDMNLFGKYKDGGGGG